ncbi:MAG: hypothetical protein AAF933_13265 [Pseudomonadota bacterium]
MLQGVSTLQGVQGAERRKAQNDGDRHQLGENTIKHWEHTMTRSAMALTITCLLLASSGTRAGIISSGTVDIRFGASGRANLQGLEWLHLNETAGLSRDDVMNNDGVAFIAGGWRYATRSETETLITSLWSGIYDGWSADNFAGASWFVDTFGATFEASASGFFTDLTWSRFFFGDVGECDRDGFVGLSCVGLVQASMDASGDIQSVNVGTGFAEVAYSNDPNTMQGLGWIREDWGADQGVNAQNTIFQTGLRLSDTASLLVRDVPAPATIALMILGLLGQTRLRKFR